MRIDEPIDAKILKVVGAIVIMPYVIVMLLMCAVTILGPLMISATLVVIGCLSLVIQWIKGGAALLWLLFKWHVSRWWWFKKNNL